MKQLIILLIAIFTLAVWALPNTPPNPAATGAIITWTPSTSPNVVSNKIKIGIQAGVYTNSVLVDNNKTNCLITNLVPNTRYVFQMSAINSVGLESGPSNLASYRTAKANGGQAPH